MAECAGAAPVAAAARGDLELTLNLWSLVRDQGLTCNTMATSTVMCADWRCCFTAPALIHQWVGNPCSPGLQLAESSVCPTHSLPACNMPYEPGLARALGAHERAVRRGPDPV